MNAKFVAKTMVSRRSKVGQADVAPFINRRDEFVASTLRGVRGQAGTGRMTDDEVREYRQSNPTYTILSYGTPIAWHGDAGWRISTTKHSMTTSRHQGIVRRAIFEQGHEAARM
mgnify:CR=1 FL=1